jgi:hypothetical protein
MEWDLRQPTGLESFEAVDLLHESAVHLWLDPPAIERLSSNNSLRIEMGPEDTLELEPSSWTANPPQLLEGKRMHQLANASALLNLLNDSTWHNPLDPFDVNRDGRLAPLDALLVINWLNQTGGGLLDEGNDALLSAEYIDVNADNWLTPLDALLLVNQLNRPNS